MNALRNSTQNSQMYGTMRRLFFPNRIDICFCENLPHSYKFLKSIHNLEKFWPTVHLYFITNLKWHSHTFFLSFSSLPLSLSLCVSLLCFGLFTCICYSCCYYRCYWQHIKYWMLTIHLTIMVLKKIIFWWCKKKKNQKKIVQHEMSRRMKKRTSVTEATNIEIETV